MWIVENKRKSRWRALNLCLVFPWFLVYISKSTSCLFEPYFRVKQDTLNKLFILMLVFIQLHRNQLKLADMPSVQIQYFLNGVSQNLQMESSAIIWSRTIRLKVLLIEEALLKMRLQ